MAQLPVEMVQGHQTRCATANLNSVLHTSVSECAVCSTDQCISSTRFDNSTDKPYCTACMFAGYNIWVEYSKYMAVRLKHFFKHFHFIKTQS